MKGRDDGVIDGGTDGAVLPPPIARRLRGPGRVHPVLVAIPQRYIDELIHVTRLPLTVIAHGVPVTTKNPQEPRGLPRHMPSTGVILPADAC
ncbi:hypothetical protein Atai01_81510 [Amycolatopsis taiwanensis]|uniref:Uncharacterized protein n=1 Tax=Amycolatopsis taiwanensis TaxID=342230 RepID=A0A9W6RCI2_9PSEU|nr:hypothetical protein Atai01_81510 [Amycolatopsis taiwanensis]